MGVRVDPSDLPDDVRTVPASDLPDDGQPQSSLGQAWDFTKGTAKGVAEGLNPVNLYQGLRHPIQPMLDQLEKARQAYQQGNTTEAMALLATGVFPVLGPLAGAIGEAPAKIVYGETPEKRGEAFGQMAAIPVGGKIIKGTGALLEKAAPPLYRSALNPSSKLPLAEMDRRVASGLAERVPVTRKGLATSQEIIDAVNSQIDSKIAAYESANPYSMASRDAIALRTDQIKPQFNTATRAQDIQAINSIQDQFVADRPPWISPSETQSIKQTTYKQLGKRAYEKQQGPGPEAEKALARGAKEELEQMMPELKGLNANEAVVIGLYESLDQALRSKANKFSGPLTGVPFLTMLKSVIQSPAVKSRLALAVNKARSYSNAVQPVNPALYQEDQGQP